VIWVVTGVALLAVGLHGALVRPHLMQKVISFNIMTSGVFLLLIGGARTVDGMPDPVAQAMVLTGIVVAVSATAVMLCLVCRIEAVRGEPRLPEDR
jgi:multicomponent Na+:H+ antiporter subunit C